MATEIAALRPDPGAKAKTNILKKNILKHFSKGMKMITVKIEKILWKVTVATLMQPLQYDLRRSAAEDNAITHAAAAAKKMHAATSLQLQRLSSKAP